VGGKRVKGDSCILQRKRVLQWLQEGSCTRKTGQAGPAKVLQEGSRRAKEVAWSLGSLQAGQTSLSVDGVAVDGRIILNVRYARVYAAVQRAFGNAVGGRFGG
jgi:hypothetical protein